MKPSPDWTHQEYLKNQYKDASNFNARLTLHARFSRNKRGWFPWLFDHLDLKPESRILELACGTGELWRTNMERVPPTWEVTLSDLSPGMLAQAQANLVNASHPFAYENIDIQSIPFEDGRFDAVIANHMLYYVPDKHRAFSEVVRVLKEGGRFFASTVGKNHLKEMDELVGKFLKSKTSLSNEEVNSFMLENGPKQLRPYLTKIQLFRYKDSLVVNEAEPLAAYILSGRYHPLLEKRREAFLEFLRQKILTGGAIHIKKDSGLITGIKKVSRG
jgi:ubiquinone/menaquinone biosynthesis C-methylase UbiE